MEKKFKEEAILRAVDDKRRDFIKKVVVGTAFAVPVINSFSMDGLKLRMGANQAKADEKKGFDSPGPGTGVARPVPASPFGP
jgi:hypothetical protein